MIKDCSWLQGLKSKPKKKVCEVTDSAVKDDVTYLPAKDVCQVTCDTCLTEAPSASPPARSSAASRIRVTPEAQAAATRHLPRRHALSPSASSCCALSVSSGAVSLQPGSEAQTQRSPSERPQATPPPPHASDVRTARATRSSAGALFLAQMVDTARGAEASQLGEQLRNLGGVTLLSRLMTVRTRPWATTRTAGPGLTLGGARQPGGARGWRGAL